ncbi:hypothetical protein BE04_30310 [Sorangium cellulosum]|uniref:Uncharacterized protein n=2 Tax=Sorangium cellulosum TaxID=56 RepID=A0A150P6N4_SORCE|nr:hypothetical protein SCE1572_12605 [Sorangium cellulosum So0157-2]KYF51335.1 hypothetical protein BE04_30310 [Sorangium cellulosum]KYG06115.1 hypothetical protein BE21_36745 [Sorangium cellulosum]
MVFNFTEFPRVTAIIYVRAGGAERQPASSGHGAPARSLGEPAGELAGGAVLSTLLSRGRVHPINTRASDRGVHLASGVTFTQLSRRARGGSGGELRATLRSQAGAPARRAAFSRLESFGRIGAAGSPWCRRRSSRGSSRP